MVLLENKKCKTSNVLGSVRRRKFDTVMAGRQAGLYNMLRESLVDSRVVMVVLRLKVILIVLSVGSSNKEKVILFWHGKKKKFLKRILMAMKMMIA